MTKWGISSTILAPAPDILRFAAYHLELGAHRMYIYLDEDNDAAYKALKSHPKIRVQTCDAAHWKRVMGRRPAAHQVRQTVNATHAYRRRAEVDWLIHMDVDEFLVPQIAVDQLLAQLPDGTRSARVRPMELLGGSADAFKAFIPAGPARAATVNALYPTFGDHLRSGFVSHVAGKVFVRTGLPGISVQIHDAFDNDVRISATELVQIDLAHCHAKSWEAWRAAYGYRLTEGSYRAAIKPTRSRDEGGLSIHEIFRALEEQEGEAGLRAFYDEVIGDSDAMRAKLSAKGLLRHAPINLDTPLAAQFPDVKI